MSNTIDVLGDELAGAMVIEKTISEFADNALSIIGEYAFIYCASLKTASFPSVTQIQTDAFSACGTLETAYFPAAVEVSYEAFGNCYALEEVSLPLASLLGMNIFKGCQGLKSISLPSAKTIGSSTFAGCYSLSTAYLPQLKFVETYLFQSCSNLVDVSLPSCESVGSYAFAGCSALVSISLPKLTRFAGVSAFYNCTALTTVIVGTEKNNVCNMNGSQNFVGADSAIFYVPTSLVSAYQSSTNWVYFSSRIKGIDELPT